MATVGLPLLGRLLAVLALAALRSPATASAQALTSPPVGARVRLAVADSLRPAPFLPRAAALVGTLTRATPDTLYLRVPGAGAPVAVARGAVRGVAVSRGASRARSALEQALGAAVGFGLAAYAVEDGTRTGRRRALGFAVGGGIVGAVVGAVRPYERWRRVRE